MNKNLSSENLFVYRNMVIKGKNNENLESCENKKNENTNIKENCGNGLNNGFILEDLNNYNNTISQGSINNSRESGSRPTRKKKEEEKFSKINQKMEIIKSSYNTFTTINAANSNSNS
jgi:hypothetical protein